MFAEEELERLRGFPEIGREELFRFFTLAPADVAFVDPGRGRGPADRLGLAVALCTLPWLGFVPDDVAAAVDHGLTVDRALARDRAPRDNLIATCPWGQLRESRAVASRSR